MFSVDVAEGVTVAFDSYPKADGSRKSEYGNCVISYNDGINIDHIMASNTLQNSITMHEYQHRNEQE